MTKVLLGDQSVLAATVVAAGAADKMTVELEAFRPAEYLHWRNVCRDARRELQERGASIRRCIEAFLST